MAAPANHLNGASRMPCPLSLLSQFPNVHQDDLPSLVSDVLQELQVSQLPSQRRSNQTASIFVVAPELLIGDAEFYHPEVMPLGLFHNPYLTSPTPYRPTPMDISKAIHAKLFWTCNPSGPFDGAKQIISDAIWSSYDGEQHSAWPDHLKRIAEALLLVDAAFILRFLDFCFQLHPGRIAADGPSRRRRKEDTAPNSNREAELRSVAFLETLRVDAIVKDLIKLENQLPLEALRLCRRFASPEDANIRLENMLRQWCCNVCPIVSSPIIASSSSTSLPSSAVPEILNSSKHLLDCLWRACCFLEEEGAHATSTPSLLKLKRLFTACLSCYRLFSIRRGGSHDVESQRLLLGQGNAHLEGGATWLLEAGVSIRALAKGGISNVEFDKKHLVLWLPAVRVDNIWTETLFKNLVAYEVCNTNVGNGTDRDRDRGNTNVGNGKGRETHRGRVMGTRPITRFMMLMNELIRGEEDVVLLKKTGVIVCAESVDDKEVVGLWRGIITKRRLSTQPSQLDDVTRELNEHVAKTPLVFKESSRIIRRYVTSPTLAFGLLTSVVIGIATLALSIYDAI